MIRRLLVTVLQEALVREKAVVDAAAKKDDREDFMASVAKKLRQQQQQDFVQQYLQERQHAMLNRALDEAAEDTRSVDL